MSKPRIIICPLCGDEIYLDDDDSESDADGRLVHSACQEAEEENDQNEPDHDPIGYEYSDADPGL